LLVGRLTVPNDESRCNQLKLGYPRAETDFAQWVYADSGDAKPKRFCSSLHGVRFWEAQASDNPELPLRELNPRGIKPAGGEALTAEKMKKCIWVRSEVVAQLEFLEWTDADHLRHSKFVGLREDEDKYARTVVKEQSEPY